MEVCRLLAGKYTRERVRAALPGDLGGVIEELLTREDGRDKQAYYEELMRAVIETGQGGRPESSPSRRPFSTWPWTGCTSSATSTTAARAQTSSSTR